MLAMEAVEVWITELIKEWTTWEWLCRPCILARRVQCNEFGHLIWSKVLPRRRINGLCADCDRKEQDEKGRNPPVSREETCPW